MIEAFSGRFRQAITDIGLSQREMADKLGGFRNDTISRIYRGAATTISIDLFVKIVGWADGNGISLRWLLLGIGPMKKKDLSAQPDMVQAMNNAMNTRLIVELAKRADVDLSDVVESSDVVTYAPDWGMISTPLPELLNLLEKQMGIRRFGPGYKTVPSEDVPTSTDWNKYYVPVIGRIAAGDGVDTIEATEYPPAWAGEFLAYEGASPSSVAVRIVGESMEPDYHDGDMVIVDTSSQAEAGEVCCIIVTRDSDREVQLKRIKFSGQYAILESLNPNPQFQAKRIPRKNVVRAYKIIGHLPMIKEE